MDIQNRLPEQVWCVCAWHIRERAESETAAAPPPEPAPRHAGHRGDPEIHPSRVIAPFLSPWSRRPHPLSSRSPPPSPGSLHPSALLLLPLGADGRRVGGVSGHLVMPLPPLDTDTSIVRMEEEGEERKPNGKKRGGKAKKREMLKKRRTVMVGTMWHRKVGRRWEKKTEEKKG